MDDTENLMWLPGDEITRAVRQQLGEPNAQIVFWDSERLVRGGGRDAGVWLLKGEAEVEGSPVSWSIVIKGWTAPAAAADPSSFNWPDRELELYSSGALTDLPGGIRAPACYGALRRDDGSAWIWLEDITVGSAEPSGLEDYAIVARRLGRFNGAYLNGTPLPQHRALSQRWTRQWVDAAESSLDVLARESGHPLVRQVYPPHVTETFLRLWATRDRLFSRLDRLPLTFCHLDVFHRNIHMRANAGGPHDIFLVDWAFSGIARLGEELATFVLANAFFMETPVEELDDLQDAVLEGYIDGLRDTGWNGNAQQVRDAYMIAMALRHGVGTIRVSLAILLGDWPQAEVERMIGRSFDEGNANTAAVYDWLARTIRKHDSVFV